MPFPVIVLRPYFDPLAGAVDCLNQIVPLADSVLGLLDHLGHSVFLIDTFTVLLYVCQQENADRK